MRDWAFAERRLPTLVSYCDPANERSIAVAERLGAVRDDLAPRQDPEDVVFRHSV
jgi:RimJ/RimL family protein N-acetyltransferase